MNQHSTPTVVQPRSQKSAAAKKRSSGMFWKFLTLSILLLSMVSDQAQAVVKTFGTAYTTSSFYVGINPASYRKTHAETIFYPSEFGGGGNITTYALRKASGGTGTIDSVYIFMKESSSTTIGTTVSLSGYSLVYKGNFPNSSSSGWMTATLATSFPYTGSGNLHVLVVRHSTSTVSGGANYYISYSSSGAYPNGYRYSSSSSYWSGWASSSASAPSYTYNRYRPHAQMNINAFAACTGTPSAGTAVASTTSACPGEEVNFKLTGSTIATSINYTWDTSSSASGPWSSAGTSTSLGGSWDFAPPTGRTLYYRCRSTCSVAGSTVTSSTVSVAVGTALTVPYSENFDAATTGVNVACADVLPGTWESATTHYGSPSYWRLLSGSYSPTTYGGRSRSGSKFLWSGYYNSTTYSSQAGYWFTPGLALSTGNTYRFSYWFRTSAYIARYYSSSGVDFGMYYGTSKTPSSLTAINPDLTGKATMTYEENSGDFTVPSDGTYFLAIKVNNKSYGYYGAGFIDDLNVIALPPCNTATASTFATGGVAAATPTVICGTPGTVDLSLSGTPAFSGLTFDWEKSVGGTTSFASTGLTTMSASYTVSTGGTYYFRCKVSCASTGISKYSDTVKVLTTPITPPYVEDFEDATVGVNVPCASYTYSWGSGAYWYIQGSPYASYVPGIKNHTPGGSKYLHAGYYLGYGSGSPQYWFTPGLALTAAKAYEVSYWYSNSGYYPAYYSSYASDMGIYAGTSQSAAGMTISTGSDTTIYINSTSTATYGQYKRGFIAPTTGTYYVGIRVNHKTYCYYGFAIDDIGIEQLPPCAAKPAAGIAKASPALLCSSSSTSNISLDGLSAASDLTFQWQDSTVGGTWANITGATFSSYTTTTPAAHKWYRCIVTCPLITAPNVDTSAAIEVKTTPITPPYFEDFETGVAGVKMPCTNNTYSWSASAYWYLNDGDFSTYYTAITNHTPGGSKYIHAGYYLGSYGSGSTEYWFTPALALTSKKAYNVSYWVNGSGYSGGTTLTGVAVGTAQTKAAMTIAAGSDTNINTSTYLKINRAFISPTTGNYYVGIKVNNLVYSYPGVAIDDIGVDQLPPCSGKPFAGAIKSVPSMICSSGSATLGLPGASMASDLEFQWYEVTSGTPVLIVGATSPSYTTPFLTSSRKYICVLKCLASASPNTDTSAVYTMSVGALTPPYVEDFESTTVGVNVPCASYTYGWGSSYWSIYGSPFSSAYPAIDNHTPGGANYLRAGYYLGYYAGGKHYWFSPAIKLTAGETYEFSYWYSGSGYSGGSTDIGMYYGASQSAGSMTAIIPDETSVNTGKYKQLVGRFVSPVTGNRYFGIMNRHRAYTYSGMAFDDIGFYQLPDCNGTPTAGDISSSVSMLCSPGTLKLNMDLGGVSKVAGLSYRWQVSSTGPGAGFGYMGAALTAPAYTTGTISATSWFRCVVKCTNTGDSVISDVIKVDVGAIIPPYIETFETVSPGTNAPCAGYTGSWSSSYWYTYGGPFSSSYPAIDNHTPGGSNYLRCGYYPGYYTSAQYWFTPPITFTAGKLYQFSFWYNGSGYSGGKTSIDVYYGTSKSAGAMTTAIGPSLSGINTFIYKQFKTKFTPTVSGNLHLGIKVGHTAYAYSGLAIDDIGLQEVPPCSAPVVAGTIFCEPSHVCAVGGTTELDLMGSTLATGLTYEWLSSTSASGPYTATLGTTVPYTTDPLIADTWFKCIVTCTASGAIDTSASFKVGVGAFDLPYAEDFEDTPPGLKPICSESTDTWGQPLLWNTMGSAYGAARNNTPGGKNYLLAGYYLGYYSYSYYGYVVTDDNFWFTPGLKLSSRYKYQLSYYYNANNSTGQRMGVFYGTSQSVGAMTNTIVPFAKYTNTSYEQLDTTFKPAISGVYYLGFKKSTPTSGSYSYPGLSIDDINFNYAPCDGLPFSGEIRSGIASGTASCPGTEITLTDTGATINLVPGIAYQWQRMPIGGAGPFVWSDIAGATDTVLSADTLVGYQYRFAVTCSNVSMTAYSAAYQLPAHTPHPNVSISPSTTPVVYCLGDSIKFNATSFAGATYDWLQDSVVVPGWKFSDFGATEPGTYMVKVSSPLSPCPAFSNQVELVVNDPGYDVTITTPADSIICAGNSILLKSTASKPGVTFQWRKDNVDIPGATGSSYLVTTGGHYRVMAHDGVSTCQAASRNILITVQPNPPAILTITNGTATACENEGVLLEANTGGFSYEWRRSGSPIVGWTDSSHLVKNSGIYSVKVRSSFGCVSISNSITVNILPSPKPVITKTGLLLGTVKTFVTYQWIRNGVDMLGETADELTLTMHGYYRVRVKDANGCEGISNPIEIAVSGGDQGLSINPATTTKDQIRIYPNPTQSIVNIDAPIAVEVTVKDVTGRTIVNAQETKSIDMSKFADGVYLFMISDKDGNELIKQQRVNKITAK